LFIITGVFGTTISPYMFFWQASEEVEEEQQKHLIKHGESHITKSFLKSLRIDNFIGMLSSEIALGASSLWQRQFCMQMA